MSNLLFLLSGNDGQGATAIPSFTTSPSMTGIPFPGGILDVNRGIASGGAITYTYDYERGGSPIVGATAATYTPVLADENATVQAFVTATNSLGSVRASAGSVKIGYGLLAIDANTNATSAVNRSFATTDVDTVGNKINITGLPFDYSSDYEATKVYFSTTGTLPSPLIAATPYYVKNISGGLRVYRVNDDTHYSALSGFMNGESVPPTTEFSLDIPIVLTTAGSGNHTLYTNPLATTITDLSGNGGSYVKTQYNTMFEVITDARGKYFNMEGPIGFKKTQYIAPYYGKVFTPANQGLPTGQKREGKRFLGMIGLIEIGRDAYKNQQRIFLTSSDVNAATGEFTAPSAHGLTTADEVSWGAFGSGAFPSGITGGNKFVRALSTTLFSLHPTATDATNNTNKITFSNTGSGNFYIVGLARLQTSDRRMIFDLNQTGNDHTFSPQTSLLKRNTIDFTNIAFNIGIWFWNFSQYNGDLSRDQLLPASLVGQNWTKLKVNLFIPSGSTGWRRLDTNLPMVSGVYWVTKTPGENFFRMHDTEAHADASIGVATASAQCIKYVLTNSGNDGKGTGTGVLFVSDKTVFRPFNDSISLTGDPWEMSDVGEYGVFSQIINFTGDATNRTWSVGKNSLTNLLNAAVTNIATGVIPNGTVNSNILLGNAAEPHVAGKAKIYNLYATLGDNLSDFTTQMQMANDYIKAKAGL